MEVLGILGPGQLGPGQLGPGQLGPGQLGPGAQLSGAQLSALKKWTVGPRGPTVRPDKMDNWAPDSWAPGQLGPGQLGPGKETLQMTYIPPIVGRICSITEIQLKCVLQMSEALCIGYILPIIGRNMSVGGFLRALSGARLGNMYIL